MIDHLVDADWLIDYLKGKPETLQFLTPLLEQGRLAISIVAYGEVYEGLLGSLNKERQLADLSEFLAGVPILGLDIETAHTFAGLRSDLHSRGQPIPDDDLWIAATALRHDLTLISRDKHFERITALKRPPA
jgi:tRNA(fMet)-specific endonuclease VapC